MRKLILFFSAIFAAGQPSPDRYGPLIRALGLTDDEIAQLQKPAPLSPRPGQPTPLRDSLLDNTQQLKLAEIAKVLVRFGTAGGAVVMGLIAVHDWPTGWPCPLNSVGDYAKEFDLNTDQIARFDREQVAIRQAILDKQWEKGERRRELRDSGASENSPEVAELTSEYSNLQKQYWGARSSREFALTVLNDSQKEKFAAFERDLELAREALELHLIRVPGLPEVLCR